MRQLRRRRRLYTHALYKRDWSAGINIYSMQRRIARQAISPLLAMYNVSCSSGGALCVYAVKPRARVKHSLHPPSACLDRTRARVGKYTRAASDGSSKQQHIYIYIYMCVEKTITATSLLSLAPARFVTYTTTHQPTSFSSV